MSVKFKQNSTPSFRPNQSMNSQPNLNGQFGSLAARNNYQQHMQQSTCRPWSGYANADFYACSSATTDQQVIVQNNQTESIMSSSTQNVRVSYDLADIELQWLTKHFPTLSQDQLSEVLEETHQQFGKAYTILKEEQFKQHKQRITQTVATQQMLVNPNKQISQLSAQGLTNNQSSINSQASSGSSIKQNQAQPQQSRRKRTRAQFDRQEFPTADVCMSSESSVVQQQQQDSPSTIDTSANQQAVQKKQITQLKNISSLQQQQYTLSQVDSGSCQNQMVNYELNNSQVDNVQGLQDNSVNQPTLDNVNNNISVEHYISDELIKQLMTSSSDENRVQLCVDALKYMKDQIVEPDNLQQQRRKNTMLKKGFRLQKDNFESEVHKERHYDNLVKKLELSKKENQKLKQDYQLYEYKQQMQSQWDGYGDNNNNYQGGYDCSKNGSHCQFNF